MKNKLIILFLFLIPYLGICQETCKVYKVSSGSIKKNGSYKLKTEDVNLQIYFMDSLIKFNDIADSQYIISNGKITSDDHQMITSYNAIDERKRNCKVLIGYSYVTLESFLMVLYQDYIFKYFYNKKQ